MRNITAVKNGKTILLKIQIPHALGRAKGLEIVASWAPQYQRELNRRFGVQTELADREVDDKYVTYTYYAK